VPGIVTVHDIIPRVHPPERPYIPLTTLADRLKERGNNLTQRLRLSQNDGNGMLNRNMVLACSQRPLCLFVMGDIPFGDAERLGLPCLIGDQVGVNLHRPDRSGRLIHRRVRRNIYRTLRRLDDHDRCRRTGSLAVRDSVHSDSGRRLRQLPRICGGGCLWAAGARIVVCDGGGPTVPELGEPTQGATGGRGLRIVEKLSSRWGTSTGEDGTTVWAEVPVRPLTTGAEMTTVGVPAAARERG